MLAIAQYSDPALPDDHLLLLDYENPSPDNASGGLLDVSKPRSFHADRKIRRMLSGAGPVPIMAVTFTRDGGMSPHCEQTFMASLPGYRVAARIAGNLASLSFDATYARYNDRFLDLANRKGEANIIPNISFRANGLPNLRVREGPPCYMNGGSSDGNSVMMQWLGALVLSRALSTQFLVQIISRHGLGATGLSGNPISDETLLSMTSVRDCTIEGPDDSTDFWAWYPSPVPRDLEKWLLFLKSKAALSAHEVTVLRSMFPTVEGFYRFSFRQVQRKAKRKRIAADENTKVRILFEDQGNMQADAYFVSDGERAKLLMSVPVWFNDSPLDSGQGFLEPFAKDWTSGGHIETLHLFTLNDPPAEGLDIFQFGQIRSIPGYNCKYSSAQYLKEAYRKASVPTQRHRHLCSSNYANVTLLMGLESE